MGGAENIAPQEIERAIATGALPQLFASFSRECLLPSDVWRRGTELLKPPFWPSIAQQIAADPDSDPSVGCLAILNQGLERAERLHQDAVPPGAVVKDVVVHSVGNSKGLSEDQMYYWGRAFYYLAYNHLDLVNGAVLDAFRVTGEKIARPVGNPATGMGDALLMPFSALAYIYENKPDVYRSAQPLEAYEEIVKTASDLEAFWVGSVIFASFMDGVIGKNLPPEGILHKSTVDRMEMLLNATPPCSSALKGDMMSRLPQMRVYCR